MRRAPFESGLRRTTIRVEASRPAAECRIQPHSGGSTRGRLRARRSRPAVRQARFAGRGRGIGTRSRAPGLDSELEFRVPLPGLAEPGNVPFPVRLVPPNTSAYLATPAANAGSAAPAVPASLCRVRRSGLPMQSLMFSWRPAHPRRAGSSSAPSRRGAESLRQARRAEAGEGQLGAGLQRLRLPSVRGGAARPASSTRGRLAHRQYGQVRRRVGWDPARPAARPGNGTRNTRAAPDAVRSLGRRQPGAVRVRRPGPPRRATGIRPRLHRCPVRRAAPASGPGAAVTRAAAMPGGVSRAMRRMRPRRGRSPLRCGRLGVLQPGVGPVAVVAAGPDRRLTRTRPAAKLRRVSWPKIRSQPRIGSPPTCMSTGTPTRARETCRRPHNPAHCTQRWTRTSPEQRRISTGAASSLRDRRRDSDRRWPPGRPVRWWESEAWKACS